MLWAENKDRAYVTLMLGIGGFLLCLGLLGAYLLRSGRRKEQRKRLQRERRRSAPILPRDDEAAGSCRPWPADRAPAYERPAEAKVSDGGALVACSKQTASVPAERDRASTDAPKSSPKSLFACEILQAPRPSSEAKAAA